MRIKTVAGLAAAAMMTTSLTVWSITPPGGFGDRVTEQAQAAAVDAPTIELDGWTFEAGDTLRVEGRLGHETLAAQRDNETFLYVDVSAPAGAKAISPAPVNLAIVIDKSGSMNNGRLEHAVQAARGMIRRMRDGDMVSVVTYNTQASTLVSPTVIDGDSRQRVSDRLSGIVAGGDTCISCGVEAGMDALRGRDGMVQRMLLLSDGKATDGVRDIGGFERIAERARDMGCAISSLGIDIGYNERIMSTIALSSNGRHYFVENESSLPSIFDQELDSLVSTVATNAELRVQLAPGVQVLQVFDRAFRREGNTLIAPMGSFAAGDDKTLLVKVRLPRGAEGSRPVADVNLAFDDLALGKPGTCSGGLRANLTDDVSQVTTIDPLVGGRVGRVETAAALRDANRLFSERKFADAKAKLASTKKRLKGERTALAKRAPRPRQAELERDFDRQLAALDDASEGFATPPAAEPAGATAGAAPPASRAGAVQVRQNEQSAADLAF